MSIANRFHLFVSSCTVTLMYLALLHVVPTLKATALLPPYGEVAFAFVGTVGCYLLLARILRVFFDRLRLARKLLLGAEYVEGTWIGCFTTPTGEKKYTIEHFEQTLDGVVIRGEALTPNGVQYAQWVSIAVSIDAINGILTYTYQCDVHSRNAPFQGIAVFQLERANSRKPPHALSGYSADLIDGVRSGNREYKLSDGVLDKTAALGVAKQRF
jgi:hypothetical protein